MELLFCDRMEKGQLMGVERLAADQRIIGAVEKIPGKRVADIRHVNADLVGPPRLQAQPDQRSVQIRTV